MIDMHCHYPMHLLGGPALPGTRRSSPREIAFRAAARLFNHQTPCAGWSVDLEGLRRGGVNVVFSVLYCYDDEFAFTRYGKLPRSRDFKDVLRELHRVETELDWLDPHGTVVVRTRGDLDHALANGLTAFVHCIEGGYNLGSTLSEVRRNIATLKRRGVAYVTLAHLFWRQVATNVPWIPFMSEQTFDRVFPQPDVGLTDLGRAAIEAMYGERILVDITHMTPRAIDETFALLDRLDPAREFPVIASHGAMQLAGTSQSFRLSDATVRDIAGRGGVVALIANQRRMWPGAADSATTTLDESVRVVRTHVEAVGRAAGTNDYAAIGSDLDGFAKPMLAGIDTAAKLGDLARGLVAADPAGAPALLVNNALRVLKAIL